MKWAHVETERQTILYNNQFDKLFHYVSCGGIHSANSQPFGDWDAGAEENRTRGREGLERQCLVRMQPFACMGSRRSDFCEIPNVLVSRDLWPRPWPEHILDACSPGDHRVQVWSRSSHLSGRRSDLGKMFTRRTNGQTDGRRTPNYRISSWYKLKSARRRNLRQARATPPDRNEPHDVRDRVTIRFAICHFL